MRYDLIIIGMGSAGMVAAQFATQLGVKVAVAERDRPGGDCLWTGCVPSKALLASAKAAHTIAHADAYGLEAFAARADSARVWARLKAIQAQIAATDDDPERFRELGIDVLEGEARLSSPTTVCVADQKHTTRFVLLATMVPVPVLLLHCYPFHRQAGYLAQAFDHVNFDVGLAINYLGSRSTALVAEALDTAPFAKQLYSSDAFGPPELHLLGAVLWRRAMGLVLGEWVRAGDCGEHDAIAIVDMIGVRNAERVYDLSGL